MKRLTRAICVMAFCLVAMMGMSNLSNAATVEYTDNVIPSMTSNISPSGLAKSSSFFDNQGTDYDYYAFKAFNHTTGSVYDAWGTAKGYTSGWLEYDFAKPKCITKYTLISRIEGSQSIEEMPKDWTFEAWDGEQNKWVVLDTRSNISDWEYNLKKEFTFQNSASYDNYRINITANNDDLNLGHSTTIGEMEMMETKSSSDYEGNNAILEITMTNGTIKEYSLAIDELESFLTWYDNRSDGIGKSYYRLPKKSNVKPFLSRKEYLSFDKIYSFEVKDYNE
ncbi:MAG: hypothetical protein ACERKN_09650 [Velocimicrobium sp.]